MWQYNLWKQIQHSCGKIFPSRSTFSYLIYWNDLLLRVIFWKVSVSFYLKRMEQPSTKPYFLVWWSCRIMQSFGKRKLLFICSLVRLFVSLRTDDIPLLEQEIMLIHLVANIFFYSHESRFHILMVWQPAIVPIFQRMFFLFHESENTLAFFKRILSYGEIGVTQCLFSCCFHW